MFDQLFITFIRIVDGMKERFVIGDVDGNGVVEVGDVAAALRLAAGLDTAAAGPVARGDVFPKGALDGVVTVEDAARILRSLNGLDSLQ